MNQNKINGYIMAIVGFVLILLSALNYIFHWNLIAPALGTMGIIFVAVGMMTSRRADNKNK